MTWTKPDSTYWDYKFAAYMHDPIEKVFDIQTHKSRAAEYLDIFSIQSPNDEYWSKADGTASGFERGQVPSYDNDPDKDGSVNFTENPVITHPVSSENNKLEIKNLPDKESVFSEFKEYLQKTIGVGKGNDYLSSFNNEQGKISPARFMFTHLVLRFLLAENNIGGLGALWHRLPADSRFPDHSIWQHNQLTSAIYSCLAFKEGVEDNAGLMVFSITPVQGYIEKARKLRDYWLGSVILSWLAFEGIRWVMENLGPDHILYPSLIDQPLVAEYLVKNWNVEKNFKPKLWNKIPKEIASFPNKFVAIIPANKFSEIKEEIEKHIQNEWDGLCIGVCEYISKKNELLKDNEEHRKHIKAMFDRQTANFWDISFTACGLFTKDKENEAERLLDSENYKNQYYTLNVFNEIIEGKRYRKSGEGVLYSVSHSLVQSMLASKKGKRKVTRAPEGGEKCQLCGEFEVLCHIPYNKGIPASEYSGNVKTFWKSMNEKKSVDFKKNERLCAVCTTKRMLDEALQNKDHILSGMVTGNIRFKSTTELALWDYYERYSIPKEDREDIAQKLHENEEYGGVGKKKINNKDRYYALLVMDGDKMGDLVNGVTIGSKWNTVMHPEIIKRMQEDSFEKKYKDNWEKLWDKKRILTPAIHAAISEALGDFAIYGVANIVNVHGGQLIYAGGDDVFAVMPLETAYTAAKEIRDFYSKTFIVINNKRKPSDATDENILSPGKLSVNLGKAKDISISAAILIAHHKEPLSQLIRDAQKLLKEKAKDEAGRDACAVELRKRSGGSRFFVRRWNETEAWNAFDSLIKDNFMISNSFAYRIETMRDGIEAIIENNNADLSRFIKMHLDRSGTGTGTDKEKTADLISKLVVDNNKKFDPQGLNIAGFLAQPIEEVENEMV